MLSAFQVAALARAGGGNNYVAPPTNHSSTGSTGGSGSYHSSGSGSVFFYSGGSHGSSGGGSLDLSTLFFIVVGGLALYLLYRWWAGRNTNAVELTESSQAPAPVDQGSVQEGLMALQRRDPNFNPSVFIDRAQATFFILQNAWMMRNLEPARIYLSDGIYRRWKLQVDQMVAQRKRNVLENLVIGGCAIARVSGDANFDSITVRIDASAADYDVDDANKVVNGDRKPRPFTEYWSFIRSRAARTKMGEAAEITQCPNCGAPVTISESGVCAYCKAVVTSGQFGWVLDNITQASQWSASAA